MYFVLALCNSHHTLFSPSRIAVAVVDNGWQMDLSGFRACSCGWQLRRDGSLEPGAAARPQGLNAETTSKSKLVHRAGSTRLSSSRSAALAAAANYMIFNKDVFALPQPLTVSSLNVDIGERCPGIHRQKPPYTHLGLHVRPLKDGHHKYFPQP